MNGDVFNIIGVCIILHLSKVIHVYQTLKIAHEKTALIKKKYV